MFLPENHDCSVALHVNYEITCVVHFNNIKIDTTRKRIFAQTNMFRYTK